MKATDNAEVQIIARSIAIDLLLAEIYRRDEMIHGISDRVFATRQYDKQDAIIDALKDIVTALVSQD
jgi:hypothetical protein